MFINLFNMWSINLPPHTHPQGLPSTYPPSPFNPHAYIDPLNFTQPPSPSSVPTCVFLKMFSTSQPLHRQASEINNSFHFGERHLFYIFLLCYMERHFTPNDSSKLQPRNAPSSPSPGPDGMVAEKAHASDIVSWLDRADCSRLSKPFSHQGRR